MKLLDNWKFLIVLCLTLGLAPFVPEPHLWGKIRWLLGGGKGMAGMDYFDLIMHGFPFILLLRYLILRIWTRIQK